jgi:phenylacetaldehyde dehydrogenase
MAAHKAANSLAAGCPTILKPTEWAPHGTDIFAEAADAAKIPPGVFQIIHGGPDVGGRLVTDRRVRSVSFTGGLAGGRAVARVCADDFKPAQLELGGNNPVVVLEDANLDEAAQGVVALMTSLNGQWCRALGRLIVHESREADLLDAVMARTRAVKIGSSLEMSSAMGPIIHSQHLGKILAQKRAYLDAGATELSAAALPDLPGHFLAPTLIRGVPAEDAQDEIFGPIGTVHTFKTDSEARALANGTPFGLEGYVFTGDEERGMRLARGIRAGGVKVNGSTMMSLNLMAPRPGWGLSGMGVEGTIETLRFFCGLRVVGVEGPMHFGG